MKDMNYKEGDIVCWQYFVSGKGQEVLYPNNIAFIKPQYPKHGKLFFEDAGWNGIVTFYPIAVWRIKKIKAVD